MTGSGSVWTSTGYFSVAGGGSGTLTVAADGLVIGTAILVSGFGEATGTGRLQGIVSNAGRVAPGVSAGTLHIDGDYTQLAAGTLDIEIGGATPGSEYDVLDVTGAANLDGELHIELIDDFVPEVGQQFTILTAGSVTGEFLTVTGQGSFAVTYSTSDVTLTALPPCPGDVDGDGDVDLADLAELLGTYGLCEGDPSYNPAADFDDSGCVDLADLATLLGNYGFGT